MVGSGPHGAYKLRVSPGTVRRAKMARVKSEKTTERLPSA